MLFFRHDTDKVRNVIWEHQYYKNLPDIVNEEEITHCTCRGQTSTYYVRTQKCTGI